VIHRAIVLVALACSGLVLASFVMFTRDQLAGASQHQASEVSTGPTSQPAAPKPKQQAEPGRFIVGAARTLTSPFASIVNSSSAWVEHGIPTLLGLLVYGVGLGYLARYSRGFA
jgi:hypothetical protein